jgi:hypothetical protein
MSGVAQRSAVSAVLCGFSPVPAISCLNVTIMVDVPMLRTAEEAGLRYLRATPLKTNFRGKSACP